MLPGDQLPAANALNMTVMQFGAIVGPLLAGLLRWIDLSTLYLIDAITACAPIWCAGGCGGAHRRGGRRSSAG
jgi:hypothetical protein